MGTKARQIRQRVKNKARALGLKKGDEKQWLPPSPSPQGFIIDEFGELRRSMTKAEARRRFLRSAERRKSAWQEVFDVACQKAKEEIQALEDARIFAELDRIASLEAR